MDETQLRNFMMIGRCASITEAADRLGIAQPSLSQQLLRLEDEVGAKLFHRTSRGVALTDSGRMLQEHAATILLSMSRAREEVQAAEHVPQGDVAFGLPATASIILGVPLLTAAMAKLPQVKLRLREGMSAGLRRSLGEGRLDLAILYDPEGARHLTAKLIARETLLFVGPPGNFGERDQYGIATEQVEPSVFKQHKLILPSLTHGLRKLIEGRLQVGQLDSSVMLELDSLAHTRSLVSAGFGYTLLPHAAIANELIRGELSAAHIGGIDLSRTVAIARNPTQAITRAAIEVEDLAAQLLLEMMADGRWLAKPIDES
jgi:LysR family nitrogen assimilation transcriptional regulator